MDRPFKLQYPPGLLEQIVDSLPGQIAYWDKDLICRFANRAYFEWFSQSIETLIGIRMQDLLGAELFKKNEDVIAGVLRGECQSFVRPVHKRDGSAAKVHVKYVPDFDRERNVNGFYVSVNDVTAFKDIEEQLREKEVELTKLVDRRDEAICWLEMAEEIAHVGHWRISLPDVSITWSDEMYRIHGVTREDYVPVLETAVGFYCAEDRPRVRVLMQRTLTQGLPYEDLGCLLRQDGEIRYVKTRVTAAMGADGSPTMIFGVCVDVTDQQKTEHALRIAHDRLEAVVHMDGLTGIGNRRRFDEAFNVEWQATMQNGHALSVVLIDVDHFKSFNDTYGHQSGDECLQAVAHAISSVAERPHYVVARYGGEEFVMLLPATDRARAVLVAERARAAVEGLGRTHKGSVSGMVTISAGVGSLESMRFGCHAQRQLIAEADMMLYRAKAKGRNLVISHLN